MTHDTHAPPDLHLKVQPAHMKSLPPADRWRQVKPHKAPIKYPLYLHSSGRLTLIPEETPALSVGALHLPTVTLRELLGVGRVDTALTHDVQTVLRVEALLESLY